MTKVKFFAKGFHESKVCMRQIPGSSWQWNGYQFTANTDEKNYDWLIVYDDLTLTSPDERHSTRIEKLGCPRENTIFFMSEPSSIKTYGYDFLNQFGTIISCHRSSASPAEKTIHTIPGLIWFYGKHINLSYDEILARPPLQKTKTLSTVYSAKGMSHNTLHKKRQDFTLIMKELLPEMDVFGRGYIPLPDKVDCLKPYRYHLAMENTIHPDYISEKLTDAFLGLSLPFYVGSPNVEKYFPAESFIRLNPDDPEGSAQIIRQAIENNEYEKRLPALIEARRLVMEEYNLFSIAQKVIEAKQTNTSALALQEPTYIYSRRALLKKGMKPFLSFIIMKLISRYFLKHNVLN